MLALQQQQQQQQQQLLLLQKLKSKSLYGHYGAQTVARSKNISSSHNPSRPILNNNTFVQQYDPKLLVSMHQPPPDSRSYIYHHHQQQQQQYQAHESLMSTISKQAMLNRPLCRCRVMYLGSSVPHVTKNGLHGIQEPLKHLYPEEKFNASKFIQQQQQQQALNNSETGNQTNLLNSNTTIDISHLSSSLGIDSWLSVWSNGLLLENVDEFGREIKRFFFIESLHYCAAVRYFDTTTLMSDQRNTTRITSSIVNYNNSNNNNNNNNNGNNGNGSENGDLNNNTIQRNKTASFQNSKQQVELESSTTATITPQVFGADDNDDEPTDEISRQQRQRKNAIRFLPLDAPLFQCPGMLDANHPPMFASIMRRTTGIKVLECHAFICRRDAASNALVRCCTQAYADFLNAKRLSIELGQSMPYNEYSKGATINGMSSISRRRRATSVASRMVKARINNSPTYEVANNFNGRNNNKSSVNDNNNNNDNNYHFGSIGASNEDNSVEVSSEDNYAIISKHHNHQQQQQNQYHEQQRHRKPLHLEEQRVRKRNKRGKSETKYSDSKNASTKSLYHDFTPKIRDNNNLVAENECLNRESKDGEKLSHSLDLLNQEFNENCCLNSSDSNETPIQYSIVKNKRHSKSMQNLDGPFEFSASEARSSSRFSNGRRRKSRRSVAQEIEKSRKATSYQDMMRNLSTSSEMINQQHEPNHNIPQPPLPAAESLPKPVFYAENNIVPDCNHCIEDETRSISHKIPTTAVIHQSEQLASSSCRAKKSSSSKRAQNEASLSRSRRSQNYHQNQLQYMEQQQLQQQKHLASRQNGAPMIYQQPHHLPVYAQLSPPVHLNGSPMYLPVPPPAPPAPIGGPGCYLSPTANQVVAAAGHYHQPLYAAPSGGGSVYDHQISHNPYLQQAPPLPAPLAPPLSHQHPFIHYPNHFLQPNHPLHPTSYGGGGGDMCSQTMLMPKKSQKAKSSLARFRCLSPPVNFLTHTTNHQQPPGDSRRNSHQLATTLATPLTQQQQQQQLNELTNKLPFVDNSGEICCGVGVKQVANSANINENSGLEEINGNNNITVDSQQDLNVDGVVSAKPSFISNSSSRGKEKKMSWIKRLSLTMISGSTTPTASLGTNQEEQQVNRYSTDPSGNNQKISMNGHDISNGNNKNQCRKQQQQQHQDEQYGSTTMKKTKRKSLLFSGSLTLGRKNKQQQQQQHAKIQITPPSNTTEVAALNQLQQQPTVPNTSSNP